MRKEVITYTDFDGNSRTEEFYFNLTKSEVAEMNMSVKGGYQQMIRRMIAAQDGGSIIKEFKTLLFKAYGEKSVDGRRLVKSDELSKAFSETGAYDELFMKLLMDGAAMAEFLSEVFPPADPEDLAKARAEMSADPVLSTVIEASETDQAQ